MSKKIKITERQLKNIVLNNLITEEDTNVNKLTYKRLLKVGRVGEDVRKLQQRLKNLGYGNLLGTSGSNKDGVDGKYGGNTKKAVEKFQRDTPPLKGDGIAGKLTINKLNGVSGTTKKDNTELEMPKLTKSPFTNKGQGDKFRRWLNDILPKIAEKHKVDPPSETTSYKNSYILNGLNQVLIYKSGVKIRGFDYYKKKNPDWNDVPVGGGDGLVLSTNMNPRFQGKIKTDRIHSGKKVNHIIDVAGTDHCAEFVNFFSNQFDSTGNAWLAHEYDTKIGPTAYSAFKNLSKDKQDDIIELFQKIDKSGEGAKYPNGSYNNDVRVLVDSLVPAAGTVKNMDMDDVVGIFYDESKHHQEAFYQAGEGWFTGTEGNKQPGNTIKKGTGWGMNTHLGVVGATKYGKPIIFHNIGGNVISEPADNLRIAWVKKVG